MLRAYETRGDVLQALPNGASLTDTAWIDLYRPMPEQIAAVQDLGVSIPTLEDMAEIEISSRLYVDGQSNYMTAMLPGLTPAGESVSGPVTFILTPERLITVRHHAPRPFETFPCRADRSASGIRSPDRLFLGLIEEVIARLADLLEGAGAVLDSTLRGVFDQQGRQSSDLLQQTLQRIGQESDLIARVRLGLLSLERVLTFYSATRGKMSETAKLKPVLRAHQRDLQALQEHTDFLTSRVSLSVDTTMGMINLQQNDIMRVMSMLAALFLPPTLIASTYGMNFEDMPELQWDFGYQWAIGLMVATVTGTYLFLRWKKWL
ncbi:magnesium transporter CorA family protein [Paracoccus aerodenitrificans]|uniref:magnesium transporter CorA family protein n=1 Tax=Paracoccus aerodenitrificans TaxID=3017781 RepID=UPI0022F12063|nr:magnesium transporter CorA family protein [Paracoccus aerodenitrificans]WBU63419.1 magnesium transporter CorA family protein [Paracoccus aerodenitrificans]